MRTQAVTGGEHKEPFDLKSSVGGIQSQFETLYESRPGEIDVAGFCYRGGSVTDIVQDPIILGWQPVSSLFGQFNTYQSVSDIENAFNAIKIYFTQQVSTAYLEYRDSYLLALTLMEAYFVQAYISKLLAAIKPAAFAGCITAISLAEKKVDLSLARERLINQELEELFDAKAEAKIIDEHKIVDDAIQQRVKQYNKEHADALAELTALDTLIQERPGLESKSVTRLTQAEINFCRFSAVTFPMLKQHYGELLESKDIVYKHFQTSVDNYIEEIEAKIIGKIPEYVEEFKPKYDAIKKLTDYLAMIEKNSKLSSQLAEAHERLKLLVTTLATNLEAYQTQYVGIFSTSTAHYHQVLTAYFDILVNAADQAYRLMETVVQRSRKQMDATKQSVLDSLNKLETRLKEGRKSLGHEIKMAARDTDRRKLVVIHQKSADLHGKYIDPFVLKDVPAWKKEQYETKLDFQWENFLIDNAGRVALQGAIAELQDSAQTTDSEPMRNALIARAESLTTKLSRGQTLVDEIVSPAPFIIIQQSPSPSIVVTPSPLSPIILPTVPPPTPWYAKFINKPWKRALWAGMLGAITAAVACTLIGLAVEIPLAVMCAAIAGGFFAPAAMKYTYDSCLTPAASPPSSPVSVEQERPVIARIILPAATMQRPRSYSTFDEVEETCCFKFLYSFGRRKKVPPLDADRGHSAAPPLQQRP